MPDRITQLNALLQKEVSAYFLHETPHLFFTVTRVQVSPDLHDARVWVSFLQKQGSGLESLKSHVYDLRRYLGERLRLKRIPRLELILDSGVAYADHISNLLQEIDVPPETDTTSRVLNEHDQKTNPEQGN